MLIVEGLQSALIMSLQFTLDKSSEGKKSPFLVQEGTWLFSHCCYIWIVSFGIPLFLSMIQKNLLRWLFVDGPWLCNIVIAILGSENSVSISPWFVLNELKQDCIFCNVFFPLLGDCFYNLNELLLEFKIMDSLHRSLSIIEMQRELLFFITK